MFFDNADQILELARQTGCTIFVVPPDTKLIAKNVFYLTPPDDKQSISVTQIREFSALTNTKQTTDQFFVITPADSMNTAAANAFLKKLEEPQEHVHYLLFTEHPAQLLPTVLSRSAIYYLKTQNDISQPPITDQKTITLAKQLISASAGNLPAIATDIAKHKDARNYALSVIATAIELLYKSYFITRNPKLLEKLPKFITLYENLQGNGHIKLHLIADLC